MGIYKDITLFCDICNYEGPSTTSVCVARKFATEQGWFHRKIHKDWLDICPECREKLTRMTFEELINSNPQSFLHTKV